ncbi:MAG: HlyD family secretion protein [Woeseiaceae bacterium]|jgi:HlyD family secretion protein
MNNNKSAVCYLVLLLMTAVLAACDKQEGEQRIVGQLESDRVEITAEIAEPVIGRDVVEGQAVEAGQSLIRQDTSKIDARIVEAQAVEKGARARLDELIRGPRRELIVARQADVEGAERALEFRTKEFERAKRLIERQLAAPELLDRTIAARDAADAKLKNANARLEELLTGTTTEELSQAEATVSQAAARLASLMIELQRHTSSAPVAGVVDSLLIEQGERPGIGQPVAILLPGQQPHARVFILETQRAAVVPGTKALVYVDGIDEALDGEVRWVSSEAAFTPYYALTERDRGRLTFAAKIDITSTVQRLPDGLPVEVELLISRPRQ